MLAYPRMAKTPHEIDPLWLLVMTGPLGSLAGCAALLRSGGELTKRAFWTAILNSGLMSLGIGTLMFWKYGESEMWLTIAVSIFAGLGGNAFIDFSLSLLMKIAEKRIDRD